MKKAIILISISFILGIILNFNIFNKDSEEVRVAKLEALAEMPIPDYFMNETPNMCWLCAQDEGWCDLSAQCCIGQWPPCD